MVVSYDVYEYDANESGYDPLMCDMGLLNVLNDTGYRDEQGFLHASFSNSVLRLEASDAGRHRMYLGH